MSLLVGEQLKTLLETGFSTAAKVTILSAYFTVPAAKLLSENLPLASTARVVVRARPCDVISGATDLRAIRHLYENGINCYIHRSLHAKLYIFDDRSGFIGSSNFTSNGLKLSGYGNLELSTPLIITDSELELVNSIFSDSVLVTNEVLTKLESFLIDFEVEPKVECDDWWEGTLGVPIYDVSSGLFIADLPWCNLHELNSPESIEHDRDVFSYGEGDIEVSSRFSRSKLYQFLKLKIIESNERTVYFGQVTQWIHSALNDDALPYRSQIKDFVANFYTYLEFYAQHEFLIDRPNYSQRITLLDYDD